MPDAKQIVVYYEGDDDKAVLQGLQGCNALPAGWVIAQRDKGHHPGKDGLIRQLSPFIRPLTGVGGRAVVLIDLDDLSIADLMTWFRQQLDAQFKNINPAIALGDRTTSRGRLGFFELGTGDQMGRVIVVPVGLPEDTELRSTFGIDRFAIDDHVLRLVRNQRIYDAVSELASVPFDVAMRKLNEVAELFRKNSIEVWHAKRYVQILRAVAALQPSTATIIGRLVKKAGETLPANELRTLFQPLLDDLEEANQLLQQ